MTTRQSSTRRKAVSSVIGALVIFGMLFTIAYGYYYTTTQEQTIYQQVVKQRANSIQQQSSENLQVYGTLVKSTQLAFYINNTGPSVSVVAYWIFLGSSSTLLQYENTTTMPNVLPIYIAQGKSYLFSNTNITDNNPYAQYVIKVLTSKGTVAVGTYPASQLVNTSVNSLVAGGIGSLQMQFSSFQWYPYISGPSSVDSDGDFNQMCAGNIQCNGGQYIIDIHHPHTGSFVPEGENSTQFQGGCSYCGTDVPLVFSVNITNDDPNQATIVINSETNLWVIEVCDSGTVGSQCNQGSPVYVFYIMDVNPTTGAVTSLSQGSFSEIIIPYGVTKTLYFGGAYDLSENGFTEMALTTDDSLYAGNNQAYYGQFAVFILFSGTSIPPAQVLVYGQNIPFESTIAADNVGWYAQVPTVCSAAVPNVFNLQVNNSVFSPSYINQITINASSFSSLVASAPPGWTYSIKNGWITWSTSGQGIQPGMTQNFAWLGTPPNVTLTTLMTSPLTISWSSGAFNALQGAASCFDTPGLITTPVVPYGIVDFVPITLFNLQSSPVLGGSQVMLNVNWAVYSKYVDNPVDNVLFFDYNGNPLNAWMENGTSSSSTNSIVWLQLGSSGIPADGSTTVYMGFYPRGNNVLSANGPFGEAPQLSATYAQYDDGSKVFSAYVNGNTPLSNFNLGSGITLTRATGVTYGSTKINALLLTGTGTHVTMVYNAVALSNSPYVAESNFESLATPTSQGAVSLDDNVNPGSSSNAIGVDMGYSSSYFSQAYESGGSYTFNQNNQGTANSNWNFASLSYMGSSATSWAGYIAPQLYSTAGGYSGTLNNNPLGSSTKLYLSVLSSASSSYPDDMYYNWMRVRAYLPNGAMPISYFGSVIAVS